MNGKQFDLVTVPLGGMDTRLRPAEGTASLVDNLHYHAGDGTWFLVEGTVVVGSLTTTGVGLHWFWPRANQQFLVVERRVDDSSNALAWLNLQTGSLVSIATRRRVENDHGNAEVFLELGRWLYFTSPYNAPQRWNGVRTAPMGFDRVPPPPEAYGPDQGVSVYDHASGTYGVGAGADDFNIQVQRGVGERKTGADDAPFRYGYGLTWVNDTGSESPMSSLVWVSGESVTASGRRMIRLRIPPAPTHIRGVRLWRTINVDGTDVQTGLPMYLHSEWGASHGFDFMDHAPDTELTVEYDPTEVGLVPAGARAIAHWRGRIWLAGFAEDPQGVRYSHALYHEQFPDDHRVQVGTQQSGRVLAVWPVPRGLVVLTDRAAFMIKSMEAMLDGYVVETIDDTAGLAARRGVAYVPDLGLMWLTASGPKLLTGILENDQPTRVSPVGDTVSDWWRRTLGTSRLAAAVADYDPTHREVWFHLPAKGDNRPSVGLVFHTATGAWSVRTGWDISDLHWHRGAMYAVGWNTADVCRFTRGSRSSTLRSSSTVTGTYAANPVLADQPFTADRLTVFGRALGSGATWTVSTKVDKAQTWTSQTETARAALALMRDAPEWGTATWSTSAYWDDEYATRTPVSLRVPSGVMLELKVSGSARLSLAEFAVSVQAREGGPLPRERR